MQKKFFFLLMASVAMMVGGCTYVTNPPATSDCKYHAETFNLTINNKHPWSFDENTQQFFSRFQVDQLTADVYDLGNWSISREYNAGKANAYQVTLPQSEFVVTDDYSYTRHIDYRVQVGYVDIQLTNSDKLYDFNERDELVYPEDMTFRLQLIY